MAAPYGMTEVARVVAGVQSGFRRCFNRSLREDPNTSGVIALEVKVGPDGEVTAVTAQSAKGISPSLVLCLSLTMRQARFPPPPSGSATLGIPFTIARQSP